MKPLQGMSWLQAIPDEKWQESLDSHSYHSYHSYRFAHEISFKEEIMRRFSIDYKR
jgi:hypothetical protein